MFFIENVLLFHSDQHFENKHFSSHFSLHINGRIYLISSML